MTDAEVDAHLYALGIGSDARGITVLMFGYSDAGGDVLPMGSAFAERLTAFGATVRWAHETIIEPELAVDYVVAFPEEQNLYSLGHVVAKHLRAGGRYMVVVRELTDPSAGVELTDIRQVGDGEIRAIGWKRRITGDMGTGGSDEPM